MSGEKRAGQTERAALEGWEEGKQDEHVCVNRQSNGSGEDGRLDSASRATSCRALGTNQRVDECVGVCVARARGNHSNILPQR